MSDLSDMKTLVEKAHRDEVKAYNEMSSDEARAIEQQSQLDTCLAYRNECLSGLKNAKTSGLSVVQVRECQLLMQYLDSVVETRQYKADISQENYEKTKVVWDKKNEHYQHLKEAFDQQELDIKENTLIGGTEAIKSGAYQAYKRLKR